MLNQLIVLYGGTAYSISAISSFIPESQAYPMELTLDSTPENGIKIQRLFAILKLYFKLEKKLLYGGFRIF